MEPEIYEFDKFQEFIRDKTKGDFLDKILECLKYVDKFPEYADRVGVIWCKTYNHFITNTKALAAFFGIKSNSVNKNFSLFELKAEKSCSGAEIAKEFPEISYPGNWMKRCCKYIPLNIETNESDVSKVPKKKTKKGRQEENAKKKFIELQELHMEWSISSQVSMSSEEMDF
jgi:hypothetical protein